MSALQGIADICNAANVLIASATGAQCFVGAKHMMENASPPRVVWVPTVDRYSGPGALTGSQPMTSDNSAVRSLATRKAGVTCHVWGKGDGTTDFSDFASSEELARQVLVALRQIAFGSFTVMQGRWRIRDGGELFALGSSYELDIVFDMYVPDDTSQISAIATITTVDQTGSLTDGAGNVLESGDPVP